MGVKMSLEYQGDLRCTLVHGPSGTRIQTDAPTDNAGKGEAFSPTDLVGAALVSCAVTTMGIKAQKEGLPFSWARGSVEKEMASEPTRRIGALRVVFELPASHPPAVRARLEEIAHTCPVAVSLGEAVQVSMEFRWV